MSPSPVVRLDVEAPCEVWLKLECLHPIGSFKLRGATSAIRQADPEEWRQGVWTTSAGNMAQGVCWVARELGVPAAVVAPDHAPAAKLDAIERLGGRVHTVPFDTWWETMESGAYPGLDGLFVHPVLDERVIAGNGVIGLELVEQLDGFDTVLVPWGGGGLTTGIASALAAVAPTVRVIACEPETGAPLSASLAAGRPVAVDYTASFVDGAGSKALLPRCGSVPARSSRPRWPSRWRTSLEPCARWRRAAVSSPKAPARSRLRPLSTGTAARAGSCASSRVGTSTPSGSRRSWSARCRAKS